MTPEEARERFSDAVEGALAPGEQYAFDELLKTDADLRLEYDHFVEVLQAAGRLADVSDGGEPHVDLLPGLQARLRAQSRGRFYRDRFAQRSQHGLTVALGISVGVLVVAALWFGLRL